MTEHQRGDHNSAKEVRPPKHTAKARLRGLNLSHGWEKGDRVKRLRVLLVMGLALVMSACPTLDEIIKACGGGGGTGSGSPTPTPSTCVCYLPDVGQKYSTSCSTANATICEDNGGTMSTKFAPLTFLIGANDRIADLGGIEIVIANNTGLLGNRPIGTLDFTGPNMGLAKPAQIGWEGNMSLGGQPIDASSLTIKLERFEPTEGQAAFLEGVLLHQALRDDVSRTKNSSTANTLSLLFTALSLSRQGATYSFSLDDSGNVSIAGEQSSMDSTWECFAPTDSIVKFQGHILVNGIPIDKKSGPVKLSIKGLNKNKAQSAGMGSYMEAFDGELLAGFASTPGFAEYKALKPLSSYFTDKGLKVPKGYVEQ